MTTIKAGTYIFLENPVKPSANIEADINAKTFDNNGREWTVTWIDASETPNSNQGWSILIKNTTLENQNYGNHYAYGSYGTNGWYYTDGDADEYTVSDTTKLRTLIVSTAQTVNDNFYTWFIANTTYTSNQRSVDLTTLPGWANLSAGNHTIKIKAKGTGYKDSELSVGVTVSKAAVNPNVVSTTGLQSNQTLVASTNENLLTNNLVKSFYNNYKSKSLSELLQDLSVDVNEESTIDGVVVKYSEYDKLSEDCSIFVIKEGDNYYFEMTGPLGETIVSSPQLTAQTYEPAKIILGLVSAGNGKFFTLPCKNITGQQGTLESLSDLGVAFIAFRTKVTLEEGTYKWKDNVALADISEDLEFTSNNTSYHIINANEGRAVITYTDSYMAAVYNNGAWANTAYQTITLDTDQQVSPEFYNWAITQGNLVKQTGYNLTINYSTVPMSTSAAYIKINSDTVSSSNYDYVVQPGTSSTNPILKNSAGTTLSVPYVVPNVEKVAFMGGLAIYVGGSTNNTSPYTLTADTAISPGVYGPTADTPIDGPTI